VSRVGKYPVDVPEGVDVQIAGQVLTAKGKLGALTKAFPEEVELSLEGAQLWVRPRATNKRARAMWGTARSIANNLITGVHDGFTVKLEIRGVGYRAQVDDKTLTLQLGYSNEVVYPIPDGIKIACERPTQIAISGTDKQVVGQVAAEVRSKRKPEPYKGKGIRYVGEMVRQKEGKKK
jgi:large subunit ribosomal protein L6